MHVCFLFNTLSSTGFTLQPQPDNEEEHIEHNFLQEIHCIAWDGVSEILYCG